jgi:hypothetical protein
LCTLLLRAALRRENSGTKKSGEGEGRGAAAAYEQERERQGKWIKEWETLR